MQSIYKFIESPDIAESFSATGKLDYEKKVRLYFWLIAFSRAREHEWFEYRKGVLDQVAWKSYSSVIPWAFGTPRTRRYWQYFCGNFDPEFVGAVNAMIEGPPAWTQFWQEFAEMD